MNIIEDRKGKAKEKETEKKIMVLIWFRVFFRVIKDREMRRRDLGMYIDEF